MKTGKGLRRRWMAPVSRDLWGRDGWRPYKDVSYDALPTLLPQIASDPFAWLHAAPVCGVREQLKFGLDGKNILPRPIHQMVDEIVTTAKGDDLTVPTSYVTFMNDASLHQRVPTCTGCYLDVPTKLAPLPPSASSDRSAEGKLLRFLNDQQCALLWYLHLTPDGGCSVVYGVLSSVDAEANPDRPAETLDDVVELREVVTCAATFEEFVHRFWMENTLWFSLYDKTSNSYPRTPAQEAYLNAVKTVLARPN